MKVQVVKDYYYVTMYDPQVKRPRRFYLGKGERGKRMAELVEFASKLKVSEEEKRDYLEYYLDKETNMTKSEYLIMSFVVSEFLWEWSGSSRKYSEKE